MANGGTPGVGIDLSAAKDPRQKYDQVITKSSQLRGDVQPIWPLRRGCEGKRRPGSDGRPGDGVGDMVFRLMVLRDICVDSNDSGCIGILLLRSTSRL